jgi:hypothetical protein
MAIRVVDDVERSAGGRPMAHQRSRGTAATRAERIRGRLAADPELILDPEELQTLADHGIDAEEVRRIALQEREHDEVSDHDRDTVRDDVEALLLVEDEPEA